MEDIAEKITQLLNDPAGMEQLRSMAEGLLGNQAVSVPESPPAASSGDISSLMQGVGPEQLGSIMKVMKLLNGAQDDNRTRLLLALRPHLSEKRQKRVDQAVKLLKLASVLPAIGESGLFSL